MAKGRMINKRIAKSDKLASLAKDRYRVIYFMLYPHLDREGRHSADPRDIKEDCCPRLRYSLADISESLIALHDVGLITIYTINEKQYLEASRFDDFQVGLHKDRESPSEIPPNPGPNPDNSGKCRTDAEKVPLNLKFKVKFNLNTNVEQKALIQKILTYFNEVTGQKRKSDIEGLISGRLAEGKTFEDFKHVIDTKTAQWRDDQKMHVFIRPSTLFRPSNFEDYLNEPYQSPAPTKGKDGRPPKTDAEKERERLMKKAIEDYSKKSWDAATPKIDAARKAKDMVTAKTISDATSEEVEKFANKVWRGEA